MGNCGCNPISQKYLEFPIKENVFNRLNLNVPILGFPLNTTENDLKKKIIKDFCSIFKKLQCGIHLDLGFLLEEISLIDKNKYDKNNDLYSQEDLLNPVFNELHVNLDNLTPELLETLISLYKDFILVLLGPPGKNGQTGASAYDVYLSTVPYGETPLTKTQWLNSLKGEALVFNSLTEELKELLKGNDGKSAYDLYKEQTISNGDQPLELEAWLNSLKGAQGTIGPKGDKGDTGAQGIQGEQGIVGPVGPQGETGAKGEKGDKGDTGEQGPQGATGPQGPAGIDGQNGEQGPKGDKGDKGDTGSQGPQGEKGDKGDPGIQGADGKSAYELYCSLVEEDQTPLTLNEWLTSLKGADGTMTFTDLTEELRESLRGPQGEAFTYDKFTPEQLAALKGEKGETGLQGSVGPQGPAGSKGDPGTTPNITINATISNTTGIPLVNVTSGGTLENPIYNFEFLNLKGELGDPALSSGENNIIEIVKVNGTPLTPDSLKAVDITIPTNYISPLNIDLYIQQYIDRIRLLEIKVQLLEGGGDLPLEFNYFYVGITKPSSLSEANIVEYYQDELTFTNPSTTEKCYVYVLTNNDKTVNFYDPSDLSTAATKIEDTTTIPNYKITNMEVRLAKGGNIIIKIS